MKKGTDSTILWKGTVRIGCVKIDPATSSVESYRLINLAEFLQVFKTLQGHVDCMEANKKKSEDLCASTSEDVSQIPSTLTASMILNHVDEIDKCKNFDRITECCICLERKPEVSLPCTHSYCLPCIEQWLVSYFRFKMMFLNCLILNIFYFLGMLIIKLVPYVGKGWKLQMTRG